MIAIDSNVLLRYLLADDRRQSGQARKLITGDEKVLVTDVVLAEVIWTLQGKRYRLRKTQVIAVIEGLFEEAAIRFENGQVVWHALQDYRAAKSSRGKQVGFPDALIARKARHVIAALGEVEGRPLGSVSHKVSQLSPCSCLTVK